MAAHSRTAGRSPDIYVEVVHCGGALHGIRWNQAELTLLDHDLDSELAAIALGGEAPRCVVTLLAWERLRRGPIQDSKRSIEARLDFVRCLGRPEEAARIADRFRAWPRLRQLVIVERADAASLREFDELGSEAQALLSLLDLPVGLASRMAADLFFACTGSWTTAGVQQWLDCHAPSGPLRGTLART